MLLRCSGSIGRIWKIQNQMWLPSLMRTHVHPCPPLFLNPSMHSFSVREGLKTTEKNDLPTTMNTKEVTSK